MPANARRLAPLTLVWAVLVSAVSWVPCAEAAPRWQRMIDRRAERFDERTPDAAVPGFSAFRAGRVNTARTLAEVERAIDLSKHRFLTVGTHTPWQIFHGVIALRGDFTLRVDDKYVSALDWISSGVIHDGLPLVEKTEHGGRCHEFTVPYAFEGHTNQFLAILALASLPRDHEFRTPSGDTVTMGDMIRHAQMTCDGRGELSWTLWFFSHYLDAEAEWLNADNQPWSMERLVAIESRKPVEGAPCGGTHRLFAISLARNAYLAKNGVLRGPWLEADQRVKQYIQTAKSLQNRDGSLSSEWFKDRGHSDELDRRLKTGGHVLEWLMVALPQSELSTPWVQAAVRSIAQDVIRSSQEAAECGALYHSLDALVLYRQRMAPRTAPDRQDSEQPVQTAEAPRRDRRISDGVGGIPVMTADMSKRSLPDPSVIEVPPTVSSQVEDIEGPGDDQTKWQPQETVLPSEPDDESMPMITPGASSAETGEDAEAEVVIIEVPDPRKTAPNDASDEVTSQDGKPQGMTTEESAEEDSVREVPAEESSAANSPDDSEMPETPSESERDGSQTEETEQPAEPVEETVEEAKTSEPPAPGVPAQVLEAVEAEESREPVDVPAEAEGITD